MGTDAEQVTRSSALFLLKLKEQRRISQVAINDIVEGSQAMLSRSISRVEAGVKAKLAESGLDPSSINGLDGVFLNAIDPFKGIGTCHLQEKYYRETLGLIVSIIIIICYYFCHGTSYLCQVAIQPEVIFHLYYMQHGVGQANIL